MKQVILNRNEIIQSPSPACFRVLKKFKREHISLYLEGYHNSLLIPKLAKIFNWPKAQIIIGYGAENISRVIFDKLNPDSDSVLIPALHYSYYDSYLVFKKIKTRSFKLYEQKDELHFDINDCIRQYKRFKPRLLLLASPNNPTGSALSAADLEKILRIVSKTSLVVLDEAYWGFDKDYRQSSFLKLLGKYPNLIILRSFSKLYSLAGLRIGFALCSRNVKNILRYQNNYLGFSRVLEEIALVALDSKEYYRKLAERIIKDREWLFRNTARLKNFKPYRSKANFLLIKAGTKASPLLKRALEGEKILVAKEVKRNLWRVSLGLQSYTKRFFGLIKKIDSR